MKKKRYNYEKEFEFIPALGIAIGAQKHSNGSTFFLMLPFMVFTIEKVKIKKRII